MRRIFLRTFTKLPLFRASVMPEAGARRTVARIGLLSGAVKSKKTRYRIDGERQDHGVEAERQNPVHQHQPPHFSRRNIYIGNLAGHADDKREIGEITIVGQIVLGKLEATGVFLYAIDAVVIEFVGVTQSEDGVHE